MFGKCFKTVLKRIFSSITLVLLLLLLLLLLECPLLTCWRVLTTYTIRAVWTLRCICKKIKIYISNKTHTEKIKKIYTRWHEQEELLWMHAEQEFYVITTGICMCRSCLAINIKLWFLNDKKLIFTLLFWKHFVTIKIEF